MKEYCPNCCRLTEGIDHFDCDNEGRVIKRKISCAVCHQVCVVENYAKPIPKFYSVRLLQGKSPKPDVIELTKEVGLRVHYTGNCIVCGKKYIYDFDYYYDRPTSVEPLCFCSPECHKLYTEQAGEVVIAFKAGLLNRICIGDQYRCFICGKTFQEVQADKIRLGYSDSSNFWYTLQHHHIYGTENGLETVRLCPECHYDVHRRNIDTLAKLVINLGGNGHKVDERRFVSFYSLTNEQMQWLRSKELQYSIS